MKKSVQVNLKTLWAIAGILLAGVFAIVAFEGIGYRVKGGGVSGVIKLHDLADANDTTSVNIYGLAVAGLVFTWLALIFPLVSLFMNKSKINQYLGYADCGFLFLGLILMVASAALFADKASEALDKGAVAGQFILIIVGIAIGGAGTYLTYFNQSKKSRKAK